MDIEVLLAKNKIDYTMLINGIAQYSRYNPKKIESSTQITNTKDVLVIGLRLAYELHTYLSQLNERFVLKVLYLDNKEIYYAKKYGYLDMDNNDRIELISLAKLRDLNLEKFDIVTSLSYIKAMGIKHPLYRILEEIKIKQMSYKSFKEKMALNFRKNLLLENKLLKDFKMPRHKVAVLVSAGPSLKEYGYLLKDNRADLFILCVGSAYHPLTILGVKPDAIIITDASDFVQKQMNSDIQAPIFYLCTANYETISQIKTQKYILFQKGLSYVEFEAQRKKEITLETGGSVATTGISLMEILEVKNLVLFGQDLGFSERNTHSVGSSSNRTFDETITFQKTESNANEIINTTSSWLIYKRWIERKAIATHMNIYNIAFNGAKIEGCPYITPEQFIHLIKENEG